MAYLPIEEYGIIGNMYTAALVGTNGSIDWMCFPHFDSPSVFAAILDDRKGGRFRIAPSEDVTNHKQFYWPDTNVLVTRFFSPVGVGQVIDYMPVGVPSDADGYHWLVRRVNVVRGSMAFKLICKPAFNYARTPHTTELSNGSARFASEDLQLELNSSIPLKRHDNGVLAQFSLSEDESARFVLRQCMPGKDISIKVPDNVTHDLFVGTVEYWRKWIGQCTYRGRWRETVQRSALALKLLTFEPTGAIIASPTCSLPEVIGGQRNWDYRYTWIRDAAFTLYALMRIGFTEEAAKFMQWLEDRCHELGPDGSLQIMYGIDGRHTLTEQTLDHLEGYKGSRPVRIGNGAYNQLQLDIYGEMMDSVYLYNKHGAPISYDLWTHLRKLLNWVCENWRLQDEGIWETRGGRQHFVYSKLMCWVALDRGVRLALRQSYPCDMDRWMKNRDLIYEEIMTRGWNPRKRAFVQAYDSDCLDAANLIMPLVFFLSPNDPRMLRTIDAILKSPAQGGLVSNSLVYRYDLSQSPDGLEGAEGSFNMCSFWLVEALTRAGRVDHARLDQARLLFEQMLGYYNHLRLYGEETGSSGEALGNFPQAFTHLGLISAAVNLDRALGEKD